VVTKNVVVTTIRAGLEINVSASPWNLSYWPTTSPPHRPTTSPT